ncbi:hypothetical protein FCIRC_13955, partial [Fusarium circinatum]
PSADFVSSSSRFPSAFVLFSLAHAPWLHEATQHRTVAGYGRQSGATRPVHPSLSLVYPPPNILLQALSLDAAQAYLARLHLPVLFRFARLSPTRKRLEDYFLGFESCPRLLARNDPISPTSPFTLDVPDHLLLHQLLIASIRRSSSIFQFEPSQQFDIPATKTLTIVYLPIISTLYDTAYFRKTVATVMHVWR